MVKMQYLLIDRAPNRRRCDVVTAFEALEVRDSARSRGKDATFLCPVCKQRARPHGGKVPVHGEHFPGALICKENRTDCKES